MTEWKEYKLGDLTIDGKGSYGIAASAIEFDASKYTYLRITDINDDGTINKNGLKSVDDVNASNYLLKPNDIVFARTGASVGRSYFYDGKDGEFVYAGFLIKFGIDPNKVNPKILKYYTHSQPYYDWILSVDNGATRGNINAQTYSSMPIILPERNIQDKIVSILSSLDDKIDLLHRENKTLEAMAETLFRQWFIEEAKEDWKEIPFGDVIEIFDSKRKPLSKMERDKMKNGTIFYPYYGAAEIMDYIDSYLFDGEFILMGEDGTVKTDDGYPILQYVSGKFWPNNHAHVLKAKPPYNNCFIWNYLKTTNIEYIVTGAVQPKINQANLLSLPFYKYPDDLLEEYKSVTQNVWEKTMNNNKQIQTLIQQRDSLLPKLMSGEVKI